MENRTVKNFIIIAICIAVISCAVYLFVVTVSHRNPDQVTKIVKDPAEQKIIDSLKNKNDALYNSYENLKVTISEEQNSRIKIKKVYENTYRDFNAMPVDSVDEYNKRRLRERSEQR